MKYRAFISYRRQDASLAARWLRDNLLRFRPPTELLDRVTPERRVDLERRVAYFVDSSYQSANEDFWMANIEPALKESEYLIVLSSPSALRPREDGSDNWVAREIETFLAIWGDAEGRRRIIVALAPDAAEDRFPGRLGTLSAQWDWADLRGVGRFAWLRPGTAERLGDALLKIIARIHEVSQELLPILRQEEARKRGRLRLAVGAVALVAVSMLSGLTWWALVQQDRARASERVAVERRNDLLRNQSQFLGNSSRIQRERGDPGTALALALEALPRTAGFEDRPYVAEAERALQDSMRWPVRERVILRGEEGGAVSAVFSPDGARVLAALSNKTARIWETATGREITTLRGHESWLKGSMFSTDGTRALTWADDGAARIWDATSGQELALIRGDEGAETRAMFSADGTRVLTVSAKTARLWEAASGKQLIVLRGTDYRFFDAVLSPDGNYILTFGEETAHLWDAASGKELLNFGNHEGRVLGAAFSMDSERVLTTSDDKTARLWETASGHELFVLRGHDQAVFRSAFSPDGTRLLTASIDGTVRIWEAGTGKFLTVLHDPHSSASGATFSTDGRRVLTFSGSYGTATARIWDAAQGTVLAVLHDYQHEMEGAALSPDGRMVFTMSRYAARLWDVADGEAQAVIGNEADRLNTAAFSPDGRVLLTQSQPRLRAFEAVTGKELPVLPRPEDDDAAGPFLSHDGTRWLTVSAEGTARLWQLDTATPLATLEGIINKLESAVLSPDGTRLLTTGSDSDFSVRLWNAKTGEDLNMHHHGSFAPAVFSPDGQRVLSTGGGRAHLSNAADGQVLAVLKDEQDRLRDAAFSADGARVLTIGSSRARLWHGSDGEAIAVLADPDSTVRLATFSPDGARVLTAFNNGTIRVWAASTGKELAALHDEQHAEDAIMEIAFSPDGSRVVIATSKVVRLVNVTDGKPVATLRGHGRMVTDATFSADGARVLTASDDFTARLWDAASGTALAILRGHRRPVYTASFSPDGQWIMTTSEDGTTRIWRNFRSTLELVDHACSVLPRPLTREQRKQFFLEEDPKDPPCGWHPDMKEKPAYRPKAARPIVGRLHHAGPVLR